MWETADWVFRVSVVVLLLGIISWALKGWWTEKNKKYVVGEQVISLDELRNKCAECIQRCIDKRQTLKNELEAEMSHIKETIETHLEVGRQRCESMDTKMDKLTDTMTQNTIAVNVLAEAVRQAHETKGSNS